MYRPLKRLVDFALVVLELEPFERQSSELRPAAFVEPGLVVDLASDHLDSVEGAVERIHRVYFVPVPGLGDSQQ